MTLVDRRLELRFGDWRMIRDVEVTSEDLLKLSWVDGDGYGRYWLLEHDPFSTTRMFSPSDR